MRELPAGFKQIPSQPEFAINQKGFVMNIETLLPVDTNTYGGKEPWVAFYKFDASEGKNQKTEVMVSDLIREAFDIELPAGGGGGTSTVNPSAGDRDQGVNRQSKTITINNAAIAREGLIQIKRDISENRHYVPGPLRMKTLRELLDHILTQIDGEDSFVWRRISDYPDYEVNAAGEVRNRWNGEMMKYLPEYSGFNLWRITGEWTPITLANIFKLAN